MQPIRGIVFDKDGTLYDFTATWGWWTRKMLELETGGDPDLTRRLAQELGYDTATGSFLPGSVVIAETTGIVADHMLKVLPPQPKADLVRRMDAQAQEVPHIEAVPLAGLMATLRTMGMRLGVATNDSEAPAREHLARSGITEAFDFVAGFDSGHGGKPAPGQLLAFCAATGLAPAECLMVGDSVHDLTAGRAAGMRTVGVLTGVAGPEELAPHAEAVLADIGELPGWLEA